MQVGSIRRSYGLMLIVHPEYPLSACIASEWSSTEARGRMLASVFFMQPLGQLCAYGAGLTTLQIFGSSRVEIDKQWRYVVGIGTFPTLLALGFRFFMPESGRYTYDVLRTTSQHQTELDRTRPDDSGSSTQVQKVDEEDEVADQISFAKVWHFLYHEGHWLDLFGTSMCWALLDFAFCKSAPQKAHCRHRRNFPTEATTIAVVARPDNLVDGLGFSAPSTLQKLWSSGPTNSTVGERAIQDELSDNMKHGIYTFSIAAILGSLAIIASIDWVNRKHMLTFTFCALAVVLGAAAGSFKELFQKEGLHYLLVVFWNLISFLFSFGPNTLTFIVSLTFLHNRPSFVVQLIGGALKLRRFQLKSFPPNSAAPSTVSPPLSGN